MHDWFSLTRKTGRAEEAKWSPNTHTTFASRSVNNSGLGPIRPCVVPIHPKRWIYVRVETLTLLWDFGQQL